MRTKTIVGGVFFVLASAVVLAGVLLYSPEAPAAPKVSWVPEHVFQYLATGGEKSTTVTLLLDPSYKKKGAISLSLTPSLEPYVSIAESPTESPLQVLTLTFTVPADSPYRSIGGTLHLRSGKSTVAKPLPITLEVSELGIPPDRGEAGNATLEGIDSDNDGVRDDVQRWVGINTAQTESGRAALTQYAKAMQRQLLAKDEITAVEAAQATMDAKACFHFIRWGDGDATEILGYLHAEHLNTVERSRRYIEIQPWLSGHVYSAGMIEEWQYKCDFDPLSMDN